MAFEVFSDLCHIFVCVAVFTAVETSIVSADIAAFDAVTTLAQALMLAFPKFAAVGVCENFQSGAARRTYAVARIISVGTARLYADSKLFRNAAQSLGEPFLVGLGQGDEFGHIDRQFFVHFDKTENAAVDIRRQRFRHIRKRFQMPRDRIFFRQQYGIVSPRDLFSANGSATGSRRRIFLLRKNRRRFFRSEWKC